MEPPAHIPPGLAHRLADGFLLLLMGAVAFALGCQELFDGDVWWHLRAGQWILDNRQVPTLDPFTFTSADQPWIDLQWLFEVILAVAYAAGGVRGMILMAAGAGTTALLVGVTARARCWPSWVVGACWLPALVAMSARLVPRPEILSFLAMAVYLSVLLRTDDHPALAWLLPAVQILWVNCHALFVLGTIILSAYLIGQLVDELAWPVWARGGTPCKRGWRWWCHVSGSAVSVVLACLANPYGFRGAFFPFVLFPKITRWGGPYKALIIEFVDLREYIQRQGLPALSGLYTRITCWLLLAMPLSFLVLAAWRAARAGRPFGSSAVRAVAWFCAFGMAAILILAVVLGLPGAGSPSGMLPLGRLAPIGLAAMGLAGAALLVRSSRIASLLLAIGGLAEAAWAAWLRTHLMGSEPGSMAWLWGADFRALGWAVALLGGAAAVLILRVAGRGATFRMLLAVAFGYLALQAIRNIGLFGLVSGFVLAWNLGEWAFELATEIPSTRSRAAFGLAARIVLAALIVLVIMTVVNGGFFRATAELRHFGLREQPLAYAHDAAQFAGLQGLPDRALVFDLRQAGVYLFHNGPTRKLFMDGRLEVPGRSTFDTYVRLDQLLIYGRPGWTETVRLMGDPLILLDHQEHYGAEATLLVHPEWRCIYYDAVGSVFVSRRRRDLESSFPSVDFAARHFESRHRISHAGPWPLGLGEAKGLYGAGWALPHQLGSTWPLRCSYMLLASDLLREAIAVKATVGGEWLLLGSACWSMVPDLTVPPSGPEEPWDPAISLLPAQATFCYRRALEQYPGDTQALTTLLRSFEARRMSDAQRSIAALLRRAHADARVADFRIPGAMDSNAQAERIIDLPERDDEPGPAQDREGRDGLARAVAGLLGRGRAEKACAVVR